MLTVIPVSAADADLIEPFSKAVAFCGKNAGYEALIVARPSDEEHARSLFANIEPYFDKVFVHIFVQDGPSGWPKGPNYYFSTTVHYLQTELRNQKPWLWCELDCTPLKPGWVDALTTEYNLTGKPFMGTICKTYATDKDGNEADAGSHLVGVAIYPPSLNSYSTLWPFVGQMPTPFDIILQWETTPKAHDTPLMQHCFRTQNYRKGTNGEIRGEDHNNFPLGIRFDQPIRPEVVLHHGCDDGSLSEVLTQKSDSICDKTENVSTEKDPKISLNVDVLIPPKRRSKIAA